MCDHNTTAAAAALLRQLDQGLNELWFMVFEYGAVADAIAAAAEGLSIPPATAKEAAGVQGLAGAAGRLATQAAAHLGQLQVQFESLRAARPPA